MVIDLNEEQPQIVISTDEGVHVVPVVALRRVINGEISFCDLGDLEIVIRAVIADWLRGTE